MRNSTIISLGNLTEINNYYRFYSLRSRLKAWYCDLDPKLTIIDLIVSIFPRSEDSY